MEKRNTEYIGKCYDGMLSMNADKFKCYCQRVETLKGPKQGNTKESLVA